MEVTLKAKKSTYLNIIQSHLCTYEVLIMSMHCAVFFNALSHLILIVQMKKPRQRKVDNHARVTQLSKWQVWDVNQAILFQSLRS